MEHGKLLLNVRQNFFHHRRGKLLEWGLERLAILEMLKSRPLVNSSSGACFPLRFAVETPGDPFQLTGSQCSEPQLIQLFHSFASVN